MALDLVNYEQRAIQAVRAFWQNRAKAKAKQEDSGQVDQGARGSVTGGKNLDEFLGLVVEIVKANGLANAEIHQNRATLSLPGFFRATKLWDVLVTHNGELIAAVELKSQVGSFGNNFNNRTEEAIGTAVDLRTAFREGALGAQPAPFTGWLMLVEDAPKSRSPVKNSSPHFATFPEFNDASYLKRYDLLCQKLMQEELYTAASIITSPQSAIDDGAYSEMSEATGLRRFVASLAGHVAMAAARLR